MWVRRVWLPSHCAGTVALNPPYPGHRLLRPRLTSATHARPLVYPTLALPFRPYACHSSPFPPFPPRPSHSTLVLACPPPRCPFSGRFDPRLRFFAFFWCPCSPIYGCSLAASTPGWVHTQAGRNGSGYPRTQALRTMGCPEGFLYENVARAGRAVPGQAPTPGCLPPQVPTSLGIQPPEYRGR